MQFLIYFLDVHLLILIRSRLPIFIALIVNLIAIDIAAFHFSAHLRNCLPEINIEIDENIGFIGELQPMSFWSI
jgi:hypothetical protein